MYKYIYLFHTDKVSQIHGNLYNKLLISAKETPVK